METYSLAWIGRLERKEVVMMSKAVVFTIQNNPQRDGILMHNPALLLTKNGRIDFRYSPSEDQAKLSRYLTADGQFLCMPSQHIRKSIINGNKGLMISIKGKSRRLTTALTYAIGPPCPYFVVRGHDGHLLRADEYEVMRLSIDTTVGCCYRSRPYIPKWRVECAFFYDDIDLKETDVLALAIKRAGQCSGILDFRVSMGGPYGSYELVEPPKFIELDEFDDQSFFRETPELNPWAKKGTEVL
jgi:hypothetical protein